MATGSPQLILPGAETIAPGGTLALAGIAYSDTAAAANPGAMYLHVWDSAGLLSGSNGAGVPVPGSGTAAITLTASCADIAAVLASLRYAAGAAGGADTIRFDLWDQAGVETTGSIPVAIGSAGGPDTWTGAVDADWNTAGNWSTGAVPADGEQVAIPGGTPAPSLSGATLRGQDITLTSGGGQGGSLDLTDVTLGAGTVLRDAASGTLPQPGIALGGTLTIAPGASLSAGSASLLTLRSADPATPATVVNQGAIAGDGGHLNIDTGGTVVNDGLMRATASGGIGFDFGEFTGSLPAETILNAGTLEAAGGGSLYVNGTVHGGAVQFVGAGGLVLEQPNALADGASIAGFGAGDTITLYLINAGTLAFANGVLSVLDAGTTVEALPMQGSYTAANFRLTYQPGSHFSNVIAYVPDAAASGPQISAPGSESVAAGGTLAVGGVSVADSYADSHAGTLALNVTDDSGLLRMTDASGTALPGSGSNAIHYSGSLAQIDTALASLTYIAPAGGGSDSISVNVWDQLGQQATSSIAVTAGGTAPGAGDGAPGGGTVIAGTAGDDTIVSSLNDVTIDAGGGNNSIFAGGTGDTITAGNGNNTIQAFAGGNRIATGAGDDTIRIAGSGSVVDAGGGANLIADSGGGNTLVLPDAGAGSDDIYGYVLAANDMFDLRHALGAAGWNGDPATLGSYLGTAAVNGGADTAIQVMPGGHGAGSVVATLRGDGAVTPTSFLAHAVVS